MALRRNPPKIKVFRKPKPVEADSPQKNAAVRWQPDSYISPFYINKLPLIGSVDSVTRSWIRNALDEKAAIVHGCRFSEARGQFTVDWVSNYCVLYEGHKAGQKMDIDDWQYEYFMQVFGWQFMDDEIGRWRRRFKRASIWIPKKNAKSPTLAATGLYLLCGDGELGQKCYSVARDGKQAMIAHRHAMEMIWHSDELKLYCKVNRATGTITYEPTSSMFMVVTGDNKKSTEGFNGCLLVDETHVVDDELMTRLSRAGISRHEPLHVEMSTSGDTVDGYGMAQFQKTLSILKGESIVMDDIGTYVLNFSAPQDFPLEKLSDEKTVLELGKKVNPTMGRIIRQSEFLDDWRTNKNSITNLRKFAMYRLNIWSNIGDTWMDVADWMSCQPKKPYTLKQLAKYPCVGGLDLSKTRDMTAFTLIFAVPQKNEKGIMSLRPYQWTWHWLPSDAVRLYGNKVNFNEWKSDTFRIVKGRVVRYEDIAAFLEDIRSTYDLHVIGYDPYNSDDLMRIMYNDYGWSEELMVPMRQNPATMGPATASTERLILQNHLRQNGDPVLKWEFGHCQTDSDGRGNYYPVKPDKDDYRKIDGIISLIIATEMFLNDPTLAADFDESLLLYSRETDGTSPTEQKAIDTIQRAIQQQINRVNSNSKSANARDIRS